MTTKNNAAQVAAQAEPCQKIAVLTTTQVGRCDDSKASLTSREARLLVGGGHAGTLSPFALVGEVRNWAQQFNAPDAVALVCAMNDLERLLIRGWQEVNESLLRLNLAQTAKTQERADQLRADTMRYLRRCNAGGDVAP